jgi:hypothetical protein
MAGLDPAIQSRTPKPFVLPWMAASVGGHDVGMLGIFAPVSTYFARRENDMA